MDADSSQSPEPGWRYFHHYHWDDNDGWLEIPVGGYCRLCNAVVPGPEPVPGTGGLDVGFCDAYPENC